jgi:hypothetical protein
LSSSLLLMGSDDGPKAEEGTTGLKGVKGGFHRLA